MTDFIISIPGPRFLFLFFIYTTTIIFIIRTVLNADNKNSEKIPEITKISPLELALVRNGVKGAIAMSFLRMWRRKILMTSRDRQVKRLKENSRCVGKNNKLEIFLFELFSTPRPYRIIYRRRNIMKAHKLLRSEIQNLEKLKLVNGEAVSIKHVSFFVIGFLLIVGLGGTKLYWGIHYEKPITFLIVLLLLSIILLFRVTRPNKVVHSTTLGRELLNASKKRFEWMKNKATKKKRKGQLSEQEILYTFSAFGSSALLFTPFGEKVELPTAFSPARKVFDNTPDTAYAREREARNRISKGGGYSGSSSGCGGCGSSGCSGCGGGCGGCGGGD